MSLAIRVITPDRVIWNKTTDEIIIPSATGQLGILEKHAPLVTTLDIGVLRIKTNEKWTPLIVMGGCAEIKENMVTVLVNGIEEVKKEDLQTLKNELEKNFDSFRKS